MTWAIQTAARTIWQEARGEPPAGQQAVAHSLINRLKRGSWGDSLGAVCLSRSQYSAWGPVSPHSLPMLSDFRASCALPDDDASLVQFSALVQAALDGEPDPTNGATHYYAESIAAPPWVDGATPCGKFGHQLFFKNVK